MNGTEHTFSVDLNWEGLVPWVTCFACYLHVLPSGYKAGFIAYRSPRAFPEKEATGWALTTIK